MHTVVIPNTEPPVPIVTVAERAALTPRGAVAAVIVRLEYQLAELPSADRAYCFDLIRELLDAARA